MRPVGGPIRLTDEQARDWFRRRVDPGSDTGSYRLILDSQGRLVGEISYRDLDSGSGLAYFNIKIAHAERGKGYAREAMRSFLDAFFNQRGGRVMVDEVALDNTAGQKALLQFGFEHDPTTSDVFRLRLTRERFLSLLAG
jgi:RimJ/RimL family protein N-acetyltransferase